MPHWLILSADSGATLPFVVESTPKRVQIAEYGYSVQPPTAQRLQVGYKPYHGTLALKDEAVDGLARLINQHWLEHCYRYYLRGLYRPCNGKVYVFLPSKTDDSDYL